MKTLRDDTTLREWAGDGLVSLDLDFDAKEVAAALKRQIDHGDLDGDEPVLSWFKRKLAEHRYSATVH
jgi:hypothetical protein